MIMRPSICTRTDTLFTYTTLFRSRNSEHDLYAPGCQVADGGYSTFVRYMHDIDAGHGLEQFSAQVMGGADARGGVAELARISLGVGNEFLHRVHRQFCVDRQQYRAGGNQGYRLEIRDGIVSDADLLRSEERRVGNECVSQCRSRWSPYP